MFNDSNKTNEDNGTDVQMPDSVSGQNAGEASWWKSYREKRALKKEEKRRKEEEKSFFQNVCEMVAFTAIAFIVALVVKNFIGQPIIVDGESMNDTLENHNLVWANKLGYKPERFDVVIIEPYEGQKTLYIKRIIALPKETVYIDEEDNIYIWGPDEKVPDDFSGDISGHKYSDAFGYFSGFPFSKMIMCPNNQNGSYTLGEDEYFCVGDNRYNSKDSRALGAFTREQIKGHAVLRLWPLNEFGNFDKSNESK